MRTDCRHYDSRTYPNREVVQKCRLDLAPEAPWRCPDDCPSFSKRRMDAGWNYGSLGRAPTPVKQPEPVGTDIGALLEEAEDVVNRAAPEILAEMDKRDKKGKKRRGLRRQRKNR